MIPVMMTEGGGRHMDIRIDKHIGISAVTKMQVKNSSVGDHLLFYNHSASIGDFSILTQENKKFLLELKESLLIMRNEPSLNRNITSTGPSNKVFVRILFIFNSCCIIPIEWIFLLFCHL